MVFGSTFASSGFFGKVVGVLYFSGKVVVFRVPRLSITAILFLVGVWLCLFVSSLLGL